VPGRVAIHEAINCGLATNSRVHGLHDLHEQGNVRPWHLPLLQRHGLRDGGRNAHRRWPMPSAQDGNGDGLRAFPLRRPGRATRLRRNINGSSSSRRRHTCNRLLSLVPLSFFWAAHPRFTRAPSTSASAPWCSQRAHPHSTREDAPDTNGAVLLVRQTIDDDERSLCERWRRRGISNNLAAQPIDQPLPGLAQSSG
jgi:hypothetical protein